MADTDDLLAASGSDESEGAPGWIVTFADMMSLLLCFFILLLSFSTTDARKFKAVADSLKEAFGGGDIEVLEVTIPAPTESGELGDADVLVLMGDDVADKSLDELQGRVAPTTTEPESTDDAGDDSTTDDSTTEDSTTEDSTTEESTG
jgi:chemotaxis protein MotB